MKKKIEVTAKKVADAIAEGLKILQLSIDDVDVKIISSGGLFKKSVIELYYGEDIPEKVVEKVAVSAEKVESKKDIKAEKLAEKKELLNSKKEAKAEKLTQTKKEIISDIKKTELVPNKNHDLFVKKVEINKPENKPEKIIDNKLENKPEKIIDNKLENKPENKIEKIIDKKPKNQEKKVTTSAIVDKTEKNGKQYKTHESSAPSAEQVTAGKEYLQNVLKFMNVDATIESVISDGIEFNIVTENSKIIGYRGEVLDSLQYLTSLKINDVGDKYVRVKLDGLDYRAKRKGILENLATKLADKCVRTNKRVTVDAMDSTDRRIIHARLADRDDVITKSEGKEPNRRVVIYLRNDKK